MFKTFSTERLSTLRVYEVYQSSILSHFAILVTLTLSRAAPLIAIYSFFQVLVVVEDLGGNACGGGGGCKF